MDDWFRLVRANQAVELFGVRLAGVSTETGRKLLVTAALGALILLFGGLLRQFTRWLLRERHERMRFWARQGIQVFVAVLITIGAASIWFDDPGRLAMALGLVTAGLPFALQKVVTALAGYLVIPRGRTFNVGLDAAERHTVAISSLSGDVLSEMQRRYFMAPAEMAPRVFYQLTNNWLVLTVRFIARECGIRELKDGLSRDILAALEAAGIGIAPATIEIVGLPVLGLAAPDRDVERRATS
jgi:hypothetical protein